MDTAPAIRHKRADAGRHHFGGRCMKGLTRQINDLQNRIRKSVHALCGGAFPGDDDPFLIRLDAVTLFAEDKPYARYHYQGKVITTLPGVIPHSEATVSQLKIEAMRQRIKEGADWRDTRLFPRVLRATAARQGPRQGRHDPRRARRRLPGRNMTD